VPSGRFAQRQCQRSRAATCARTSPRYTSSLSVGRLAAKAISKSAGNFFGARLEPEQLPRSGPQPQPELVPERLSPKVSSRLAVDPRTKGSPGGGWLCVPLRVCARVCARVRESVVSGWLSSRIAGRTRASHPLSPPPPPHAAELLFPRIAFRHGVGSDRRKGGGLIRVSRPRSLFSVAKLTEGPLVSLRAVKLAVSGL
jgi:hypothetical protein